MFAIALPVALWLAVRCCKPKNIGWRLAFLSGCTLWSVWLVFITELLSPLHAITRPWLAISWILFCLFCLSWLWRDQKREAQAQFSRSEAPRDPLGSFDLAMLGGIGFILTVTAALAIIAPPNTDDVMEYHLPRVVLWASNHSVQFFPAFDFAQLIHTPWAEYLALHIYVLSSSDRFINLIEWFSFVGCVIAASSIAERFGASIRGQILAAVFCAALPEAILESSGSNNTAVGALWIACAVVFLLTQRITSAWIRMSLAGAAVGLAVLTKGTAVVFLPAILLAVCIVLRPKISSQLLARSATLGLIALLINAPQFLRNYHLTGTPLGLPYPEAGVRLRFRNEVISPSVTVSGVIRNAALHLVTPSAKINARTETALRWMIRKVGADPDDPRTSWLDTFRVPGFSTLEYWAGNPPEFLLLCVVLGWGLIRWRSTSHEPMVLLLGTALAFVLFCAVMKWNPSGARYHLPLFVLGAGVLGALLPAMFSRRLASAAAVLALVVAFPFVFSNGLRSLLPSKRTFIFHASRNALYFADDMHRSQEPAFAEAADDVARSGCNEVGVDATLETYVYPMMAFIHQRTPNARFQYSGVENPTSVYAGVLHRPAPCVVVCLGCMKVQNKWAEYRWLGAHVSVIDDIDVFRPGGGQINDIPEDDPLPSGDLQTQLVAHHEALSSLPAVSLVGDLAASMPGRLPQNWDVRAQGVYEVQMRSQRIWEWSEPLRLRSAAGTATPGDMDVLTTVDQALIQLRQLFDIKLAAMKRSSFP